MGVYTRGYIQVPGSLASVPDRLPCRHLAADLSDRHPADLHLFREPGLASVVRATGRGQSLAGWSTSFLTLDGWRSLVLPSITLGLFQMTLIMRLVRSEMLEVLRTDYIKLRQGPGPDQDRSIHFRHALKNTLIPVITITGLQIGSIIAFAHHHRDGVPVAGHGRALRHRGPDRRYSDHGRISVARRSASSCSST